MFQTLENISDSALIIFVKNPRLGKVKSRLAVTIGESGALASYRLMMNHTALITSKLEVDKFVFYSDEIDCFDIWKEDIFTKKIQDLDSNLGVKMAKAFDDLYGLSYSKILIIGSDCLLLSEEILNTAFDKLSDQQVVIGPSEDGGYYLIGFNFDLISHVYQRVLAMFFLNKVWSHPDVLNEAVEACHRLNLQYFLLPILADVDTSEDLARSIELLKMRHSEYDLWICEELMKLKDLWQ